MDLLGISTNLAIALALTLIAIMMLYVIFIRDEGESKKKSAKT